ncbi:hypothetical protein OIDMADRAFT_46275 [Oidiodendron maius Zn]|uniref:Uncharacterized protein n=1 Tax=Oidiodendron maius (strain Zn) TaxID=913774 RepID=A0A0C3GAU7_OIDMZ|nr:hypothetical protein OIDMADRAFT_46275 [Oidiodendron maius Zn]
MKYFSSTTQIYYYRPPPNVADRRGAILVSYHEIPHWYQDNDFVLSGYRPESNSIRKCLESWFYSHNETINIYSHLLPAILFLVAESLTSHYFRLYYPNGTLGDRLVFIFFLLSATVCLGMSAAYHTLMNHSVQISRLWLRFDFIGIVILTLGAFVSGTRMVFYCEPALQKMYWTMILVFGSATIVTLMNPKFQGTGRRNFRVRIFVSIGLLGFVPLIHGIVMFGTAQMVKQSGILYYLCGGLLQVMGAVSYSMRLPETFKPGRFDIYGHSHQIFHVFVVLGTTVHLAGILTAFDYNYQYRICTLP